MIDKNLLRQLGWSEDLISEVTRVSDTLRTKTGNYRHIEEPIFHQRSVSGSSVYMDEHKTKTSYSISFKTKPLR
jgi:hypothetical protein